MNVKVDADKCIGCGNCVALSESKVFDFNDDGLAEVVNNPVSKEFEEIVNDSISQCPTDAIKLED